MAIKPIPSVLSILFLSIFAFGGCTFARSTGASPTAEKAPLTPSPVLERTEPKAIKQLFATIEIPTITQEAPAMDKPTSQNTGDQSKNPLVQQAKENLANRLNVETEQIELVEFKAMVWPDGSLGCPQPGVAYTQVQREGYLIRLNFEGKLFDYHGGENRSPFLCEKTAGDESLLPPSGLGDD